MKQTNAFQRYLESHRIKSKEVELELSDSDGDIKSGKKEDTRQLKIDDLFNMRKKTREILPSRHDIIEEKIKESSSFRELKFDREQADSDDIKKFHEVLRKPHEKLKTVQEAKIYESTPNSLTNPKDTEVPIYSIYNFVKNEKPSRATELQLYEEEKRLKKQKKKEERHEEEKKKLEEQKKRKNETFQKFLCNITTKTAERNENQKAQENQVMHQLNNISMYNKIEEENMQQMISYEERPNNSSKNNAGFIYKKLIMEKEKIPIAFLKILLSYKFSSDIPTPESKKVPNDFEDQMTYKKIFHYLIVNECIADIHTRLLKLGENKASRDASIPVTIANFKKNHDGFIQFTMSEVSKDLAKQGANEKEEFMLRNFSLSRNRLGIVTNSKHFNLDLYGVPSKKNDRIFSFLCLLITPESKEDLNSEVKALTNIEIDNLDIILKMNKTNKAYFHDLEKISTHLREYSAVTNLYDTEVCSLIYNPTLIQERSLEMIHESERDLLEPILQTLKREYNNTQYESIREMVLRESGVVLLQGPPGTGKTTTLMGLLAAEFEYLKNISNCSEKRKILICAPSNAAINHITKRLVCEGLLAAPSDLPSFSQDGELNGDNTIIQNERVYPQILRVGIVDTDDEDIISVSLDDICDKKMSELRNSTFKRNNITTTEIKEKIVCISKEINKIKNRKDLVSWQIDEQVNVKNNEIKKFESLLFNFRKEKIELKQAYNQIENQLFENADIILTTLSSSGSDKMEKVRGFIGCLIVDEAAQSTEPNILIPLQTGVRKVLLVGDPYQLPSTTMSHDSSITLFNRSLFERLLDNGVKPYFLNIQYRMAPLIRQFPSFSFYNNRLIDAENVLARYEHQSKTANNKQLQAISQFFNRNSIFIDVKYGEEEFVMNSYRNFGECEVTKKLILDFIKNTKLTIGVITPYQSQRRLLNQQLKKEIESEFGKQLEKNFKSKFNKNSRTSHKEEGECEGTEQNEQNYVHKEHTNNKTHKNAENEEKGKSSQEILHERVMINTVDSFQGQEKDIIIVSTVRSNERKDIGFMKDERRINVALTRARHLLIVVGNGNTIGSNETWNNYLNWIENKKTYYQINYENNLEEVFVKLNKGECHERVERLRHKTFSKDLRKIERQEIKREDFGLGKSHKKVKKDGFTKHTSFEEHNEKTEIISSEPVNIPPKVNEFGENLEEFLEEKKAKEQEAIQIEEVNRRIKELEERLKLGENNPYANLFN